MIDLSFIKRNQIDKRKTIFLLGLLLILQLIIYTPHVGTGFVTDDFVWLGNVVVNGEVDHLRPFTVTTGFYRPMVSLSFGLQYYFHGMNARPYGWFNLFLHLLNIILVYLLFSSFEVSRPYSLAAAALFALNVKGNIMAVGWISGRTTLLFAFFTLLSFYLYLKLREQRPQRQQNRNLKQIFLYFLDGLLYLAALLSKETALAVPVFVFLFSFFYGDTRYSGGSKVFFKRLQTAFRFTLVFIIPLIFYFFLRLKSNAIHPFNAPDVYSYTLAPLVILKNLWEYFTRAGMLDILIAAYLMMVVLFTRKKLKPMDNIERKALLTGLGWFLCFLLPVILLPVRSDIYVYVPQVGLHLVFLILIFHSRKKTKQTRIGLLIPVLLVFAWVVFLFVGNIVRAEKGNHSTVFCQQIPGTTSMIKTGSKILLVDMEKDKGLSPTGTVSYGFGSLLNLCYPDKQLSGEIIPPANLARIKCDNDSLSLLFWKNGQLVGPFNCKELIELLIPYHIRYVRETALEETPEEQKELADKRLHRLKKRKMRLRLQKLQKKKK